MEPHLLTTDEAAAYLRVTRQTLQRWRSHGKGPSYFKFGGSVRYSVARIDHWLERFVPTQSGLEDMPMLCTHTENELCD